MKKLIVLCAIFLTASAKSQTADEWFAQKKTKLKYIAEQIAAFEAYAGYLKQGYDIVEKGWSVVNDIKHGDFDLHNNYFTSLKEVNGSIASYRKVDSITSLQVQILQVNEAINKFIRNNENIQSQENEYITKVMSNLLDKCAGDLGQLTILTTNDSVEMKDDERLRRIDDLYNDMQNKYAFARHFQNSVQTLALSRAKNINDVKTSQLLNGIK
jgi:hypothetical protein